MSVRRRRAAARLAASVGVVAALGLASSAARADTSFALSWRSRAGATPCVTEAAVRDAVEKKLGRRPFTDREHADILIEGDESRSSGRFRATVTQRDRRGAVLGSRDLDADSCSSLIRTTAVVVALFIEPGGERRPDADGERAPDAPQPGAIVPAADADVKEQREAGEPAGAGTAHPKAAAPVAKLAPPTSPFELSMGAGAAVAVGLLPAMSVAPRIVSRLGQRGSRLSFGWSAGYSIPQVIRDGAVRGTFAAIDQQLAACFSVVTRSSLDLDACGGAFWGAVLPRTTGVREKNDAFRPLIGPMASLSLQLGRERSALRFDVALAVPQTRRAFTYLSAEGERERFYTTGRVLVFAGISGALTIL